jgi:hypothetical protein
LSDDIQIYLPAQLDAPDTPDPFYNVMKPKWDKVRTVLAGTQAMRDAGEKYTPKFEQETLATYQRRLNKTHLTNVLADSIDNAVAKPFSKELTLDPDESHEMYQEWAKDIDRQGSDFNTFGEVGFYTSLGDGLGYLLADSPSANGEVKTVADEKAQNIRPYLVFIDAPAMKAYRTSVVNGAILPTYIRYETCSTDFDEKNKAVEVSTVHEIQANNNGSGFFRTYEKRDKGKWDVINSGPYYFDQVTIVRVNFGKNHEKNKEVITPPFLDLAETNIAHWNSQSDQINILEHSRFAMYHFKGVDKPVDEDNNEVAPAFGPNTIFWSQNHEASIETTTLPVEGLIQGWTALDRMVDEMKMMGLDPLVPSNSGALTASERIIDEKKSNSALANWAERYAKALEQAVQYMGLWAGLEDPTKVKVQINTEFGVTEREINEIKILREMQSMGQLSLHTLLNEVKNRQVFDEDFNTERELEFIAQERDYFEPESESYEPPPNSTGPDNEDHKGGVKLPPFTKAA